MLIKNVKCGGEILDILITAGKIAEIGKNLKAENHETFDGNGKTILPAFVDVHTHLREPGFCGKETIETGSRAAVKGGFSAILAMPNTNPVCDNEIVASYVIQKGKDANLARVFPVGAISKGLKGESISEFGALKEAGVKALSDDGLPVTSSKLMSIALDYAKHFDLTITAHEEDLDLVAGGDIHDGKVASRHGIRGISPASEEVMIARDLILAKHQNAKIHIAHVSTKFAVELIRFFKSQNVNVTCETCPHYLFGTDQLLEGFNPFGKVNPPLREEEDRQALIEGLKDGTIDVIATDHAPHKESEKTEGFAYAPKGISGLETAFQICHTVLVKGGHMRLEKLSQLMSTNPAKIFDLPCGKLEKGGTADLVIIDTETKSTIDPKTFVSKGKNTPFSGREVIGEVIATIVGGEIKFKKEN